MNVTTAGASRADGAAAQPRHVDLAPFGWYTRYRIQSYCSHCFVTAAALTAIGISIDLPSRISGIMAHDPAAGALSAALNVAWYVLLRIADIITEIVPIATFLGVLWSEAAHTWSRERLTIWNTGRSPLRCMIPTLLFAVALAGVQGVLDIYLRPAAVMAQVAARLGDYGERFDRQKGVDPLWVAAGTDIVRGHLDYGPPPVLREIKVFKLDTLGQVRTFIFAERAMASNTPGKWIFERGKRWDATGEEVEGEFRRAQPPSPARFESQFDTYEMELSLPPLWLSYRGIQPQYLPQSVLLSLAQLKLDEKTRVAYRAWIQIRYGRALLTLTMVFLAATLSMLVLTYTVSLESLLLIAFAGYGAHVLMRVFIMLGEFGQIPPAASGWTVPVLLLVFCTVPLFKIEQRAGK